VEIKPCAFCGCQPRVMQEDLYQPGPDPDSFVVICESDDYHIVDTDGWRPRAEAVALWNKINTKK
jgi:hypothetical protein